MTRIRVLFYLHLATHLPGVAFAQFCTSLNNNTWAGFVEGVKESSQNGLAILCPFEIRGEGCPSQEEYPLGLVVDDLEEVFISCDRFQYGFNTNSECKIDCPGRHFTVSELSKLTLERLILSGATDSSIKVEEGGSLTIKNSILKDNIANDKNGGAIRALMYSTVTVEYSQFMRNEALYGGAIYGFQESRLESIESVFEENKAVIAGGAYANDVYANVRFENSEFYSNEASAGGGVYIGGYSIAKILGGLFDKNTGINGGAIFDGGALDCYDATFNENVALNSGGAIYIDAGSSTTMHRNELVNNRAALFGPAVNNRFNINVNKVNNTACGNTAERTDLQCNGVFVFVGRRQRRCEPFAEECTPPTAEPTISPAPTGEVTSSPTPLPTQAPSARPTFTPSASPSFLGSQSPTIAPSVESSASPSLRGSSSPTTTSSEVPSSTPSIHGSSTPTITRSEVPSSAPSIKDSSIPTSEPSISPSIPPSVPPSGSPSVEDSSRPTTSPSISPTEVASAGPTVEDSSTPSIKPTYQPTLEASTSPSDEPTPFPTNSPSEFPTVKPTRLSTPRPTDMPRVDWSTNFPLDLCQGDCDNDNDCRGDLICFQRGRFTAVPGCRDGEQNGSYTDYCIRDPSRATQPPTTPSPTKPPTAAPTLKPTRPPTTAPTLMASQSPTVFESSNPTSKPTWRPSSSPTTSPSQEASFAPTAAFVESTSMPTISPSSDPTMEPTRRETSSPTNDVKPPVAWSDNLIKKLCEGDCDADWECEGDLICFQRNEFVDVPGCTGGAGNGSRTDYCVKPEYANRRS